MRISACVKTSDDAAPRDYSRNGTFLDRSKVSTLSNLINYFICAFQQLNACLEIEVSIWSMMFDYTYRKKLV